MKVEAAPVFAEKKKAVEVQAALVVKKPQVKLADDVKLKPRSKGIATESVRQAKEERKKKQLRERKQAKKKRLKELVGQMKEDVILPEKMGEKRRRKFAIPLSDL